MPFLAMMSVVLVFFGFRAQISEEVQWFAYRFLRESSETQAETIRHFLETEYAELEAIAALTGDYYQNSKGRVLIEKFYDNIAGNGGIVCIGFADKNGILESAGDYTLSAVGSAWFASSCSGERAIEMIGPDQANPTPAVLLSVPVYSEERAVGAMFAVFGNESVSELIKETAYDSGADFLLCDASAEILLRTEDGEYVRAGGSVFDVFAQGTMQSGATLESVERLYQKGAQAAFTIFYEEKSQYAVCQPVGTGDLHFIVLIPLETVESVDRTIGAYAAGMLGMMLLVGISSLLLAYLQNRRSVVRLEREKELLHQSGEKYALLNRLSNDVFFTVDMESSKIQFNDNFETAFGYRPPLCTLDEMVAGDKAVVDEDRPRFVRFVENMKAGEPGGREELRLTDTHGIARWQRLEFFTAYDANGKATQIVGKISDINRQKQSMQRLMKKAESDSLTGLLNRAAMEARINEYFAGDGKDGLHAFLMLDIDNFKVANDTLGHLEGDRMLMQFAASLRRLFRSNDLLARMGGDEFAVLMKGASSEESALNKARELNGRMAALSETFGVYVTVSVGIAIFDRHGTTFDALYKKADATLYRAKNAGKNEYLLFDEKQDSASDVDQTREEFNGTT